MTDPMAVPHVPDASTAITRSSLVLNLRNAVSTMENAPVHLDSVAMTVRSRFAAHWQTEKEDHPARVNTATAKRDGKASTAMFAPPIRRAT